MSERGHMFVGVIIVFEYNANKKTIVELQKTMTKLFLEFLKAVREGESARSSAV